MGKTCYMLYLTNTLLKLLTMFMFLLTLQEMEKAVSRELELQKERELRQQSTSPTNSELSEFHPKYMLELRMCSCHESPCGWSSSWKMFNINWTPTYLATCVTLNVYERAF